VIEAKVLSDIQPDQLRRYEQAFPSADAYHLLHLEAYPATAFQRQHPKWKPLTWEAVLDAYERSENGWIVGTVDAWRRHLKLSIPRVGPDTAWNDVRPVAADFELDMRARMVWLARAMDGWCEIEHDLVQSSAGGSWVVRMKVPSTRPGYRLGLELEEGMTAQQWRPDPLVPFSQRMKGPRIWLGLVLESDSSETFDWDALFAFFAEHVLDAGGQLRERAWSTTRSNLRDPDDRQRWADARARSGAPEWIGKGYGMRSARTHGQCMFGAHFRLPPDAQLSDIDTELRSVEQFMRNLGASITEIG
jgi:hypothetical protein